MSGKALAGVKVVEMGTMVAGPYCGKLLADMGADVIKVEPPSGDASRQHGPFPESGPHPERSALFLYNNTSKRGVTLDATSDEGGDALRRLAQWGDILIDNLPERQLERLGFDWATLAGINPALVYVSITPYGRTGPRADVKGDELTIIQAAGLGNLLPTRAVNTDRAPIKMAGHAVGYHAGMTAAVAVMGALIGQRKTGRGRLIDLSLQEAMLSMVRPSLAGTRYDGTNWGRVPDRPPAMGRMQTSDGYVVVGTPENHHFKLFRELMGNPEWVAGKDWEERAYRTHHQMEVAPQMEEWMHRQKKHDIHRRGGQMGIAVGALNSAEDLMKDEHYAAREYFVEVDHPEAGKHRYAGWAYRMTATSPEVSRPAPLLGEHNREVFSGVLAYSEEESARLAGVR